MIYNEKFLNNIKAESYVSTKIEKREVCGRGYGLFAKELILKGEIVSISGGVIIDISQLQEFKDQNLDYTYHITDQFLICPLNPDDPSDDWRMNHCCEPNCGLDGNIVFIAIKDIQKDQELTYDYCMTEIDPLYSLDLSCDKSSCRKILTGNDWKNSELQKKYGDNFSNYIKKKIKHLLSDKIE